MHVRLEALDAAVLTQHEEALGDLDLVGRNVDGPCAHQVQRLAVLWLLAFWIEIDAELDIVGDVLAAIRIVDVPRDPRAGKHQLPAVGPHDFALLAHGPLHERAALVDTVLVEPRGEYRIALVLLEPRDGMMGALA